MNQNKLTKITPFVSYLITGLISFGMAFETYKLDKLKYARKDLFAIQYRILEPAIKGTNITFIVWGFIVLGIGMVLNGFSKLFKNDEVIATIAQILILLSFVELFFAFTFKIH